MKCQKVPVSGYHCTHNMDHPGACNFVKDRVRLRSNPALVGNFEGSKRSVTRAQKYIRERNAERDAKEMEDKHLKIVPPRRDWHYKGMEISYEMYLLFMQRDDEMVKHAKELEKHIETMSEINRQLRVVAAKEGIDLSDVPEAKQ